MLEKLKKLKKSKKKGNINDLPVKQDEPERKWKYVIIFSDECKDSVEVTKGKDSAVVKSFDSPEELVEWVKNNMGLSIEITDFHLKDHYEGNRIVWG